MARCLIGAALFPQSPYPKTALPYQSPMHIQIFLQLRWETLRIPIPNCYRLWRKGDQLPRKPESIWISLRSGEVVAADFTQERRRNWDLPMERKSPIRILRKFSFHLPASRVERVFTSCGSLLPQALQLAKMSLLPIRHRQHLQPLPHQRRRCLPPQPALQLYDTHHRSSVRYIT